MEQLWSISTTVREAERVVGFLNTAIEINGKKWDDDTQRDFQIRLIKNREYLNHSDNTQSFNKLNPQQIEILKNKEYQMTYEEAKGIFEAKHYEDPAMRGRQSMSPLVKLGLVFTSTNGRKIISVSDVGKKLANGEIDFSEFMLDTLLKYQYPNPCDTDHRDWNTKPFINTLRLIKRVNELCKKNKEKPKGISKTELGIFALSLKNFKDVNDVADRILQFRKQEESCVDEATKKVFVDNYIKEYLSDFQNPVGNVFEYLDNTIRYIRLTRYIYIRGKYANTYIDLEPMRMTEINSILDIDDGQAQPFTEEEWHNFIGVYGTYELPFETVSKLTEILNRLKQDISSIEEKLALPHQNIYTPDTKDSLKEAIAECRKYRTKLQNLEIKAEYHENADKIDEVIDALNDIRTHNRANLRKKYSIELEKWSNVALNIINDALFIKPNAPVGDDNEPIYTAPSGVADIECYYQDFVATCEVTMLVNRDQWHNEGQPVMRHLRSFEETNSKPGYCLFIAPKIHQDTVNTFYMSVKYEFEGEKQKIIPITIQQLESILKMMKTLFAQNKKIYHSDLRALLDDCTNVAEVVNSRGWLEYIKQALSSWEEKMIS